MPTRMDTANSFNELSERQVLKCLRTRPPGTFSGKTIHANQVPLNHPQVLSHHDTNQKSLPTNSCEIDVFVYPVVHEFPEQVLIRRIVFKKNSF